MVFAAVPWVLAAGVLGPLGGALIGALAGLFSLLFSSHSAFIPLETALMAVLFSLQVRQRFRTAAWRIVGQPLIAALVLLTVHPLLYVLDASLLVPGSAVARLDYSLATVLPAGLAFAAPVLVAGIAAQICAALWPRSWRRDVPLEPSPAEKSIETRFQLIAGALTLLLLVSLLAGGWIISGRTAREMLDARMGDIAQMTAKGVPFFLQTGQSLASGIAADESFQTMPPDDLGAFLSDSMLAVPYFEQLVALDETGDLVAAYPPAQNAPLPLSAEETSGLRLARQGVNSQLYTLAPETPGGPARVSYLARPSEAGAGRILLARTSLAANPASQPFVVALEGMEALGGDAALVDETGLIVYHSDPDLVMTRYLGQAGRDPLFYDDIAPDGTRSRVYYEHVSGTPWSLVLTVPARVAQQMALGIAAPLSLMVILLSVAAFVLLHLGVRSVSLSLRRLAYETERIAAGDLDHPLETTSVDEVGQLTTSFEGMRVSLAAHLAEVDRLLSAAEVGRQRLSAILASTPDPVLVTDSENHLLLANPAAREALGAEVGEGEGRPVREMITQRPLLAILLAAREEQRSTEVELPDGRTYLATASPVMIGETQVGRVCILRDVTHFKELDTLKTEFVSTVSHDLRSPLTLIRGYATMLELVGDLNDQQRVYSRNITAGVENMTRLTNNLLDLGRIEAGVGLRLEALDVPEVVDRVVSALQPHAARKNVILKTSRPPGRPPPLYADVGLFQQAVHNLVENGIKYTGPGGEVTVVMHWRPPAEATGVSLLAPDYAASPPVHKLEDLRLEVRDTGIGIPPADLPRLFEKFYRGTQRESRQEKGSGLGLAIVRSIVEKHGGRVWVESQLGRGSSFFIQIPLARPRS
jgi:PAS domain S-box-containing protein